MSTRHSTLGGLLPRTVATVPIVRHVVTHAHAGVRTRPRSALNTVRTVATVRDSSGSQTHLNRVRARKARNPTSTWATTLARVPPVAKYRRYVRPARPCATRAILGRRGPSAATWPHHQSQRRNLTSTEADR